MQLVHHHRMVDQIFQDLECHQAIQVQEVLLQVVCQHFNHIMQVVIIHQVPLEEEHLVTNQEAHLQALSIEQATSMLMLDHLYTTPETLHIVQLNNITECQTRHTFQVEQLLGEPEEVQSHQKIKTRSEVFNDDLN